MSARDELANLSYLSMYPKSTDAHRIQPLHERAAWEIEMHERAADAILAAGYAKIPTADYLRAAGWVKPRTITTAEELDGLAQGTKLYSTKTTHSWNLNDLSQHGGTKVQGTGGGYTYIEDFIKHEAPLVVLYEPAP